MFFCFFAAFVSVFAKTDKAQVNDLHVAVFIPLQLHQIYPDDGVKIVDSLVEYPEEEWDFYVGTRIALDSLKRVYGQALPRVHYYDLANIKPDSVSLKTFFNQEGYTPNLVIGYALREDYEHLAEYARKINVPFVSAIYPNVLEHENNPSVIVLNSDLNTNAYKTLRAMTGEQIYIVTRVGEYPKVIQPLLQRILSDSVLKKKVRVIPLSDSVFTQERLRVLLPVARPNVNHFFLLTFDNLLIEKTIALLGETASKTRSIEVGGLPFWVDLPLREFSSSKYLTLLYTRSFYYSPDLALTQKIKRIYEYYFFSPFRTMVGLGVETMLHFVPLLVQYPVLEAFRLHVNDTKEGWENFTFCPVHTKAGTDKTAIPPDTCLVNTKVHLVVLKSGRTYHL